MKWEGAANRAALPRLLVFRPKLFDHPLSEPAILRSGNFGAFCFDPNVFWALGLCSTRLTSCVEMIKLQSERSANNAVSNGPVNAWWRCLSGSSMIMTDAGGASTILAESRIVFRSPSESLYTGIASPLRTPQKGSSLTMISRSNPAARNRLFNLWMGRATV